VHPRDGQHTVHCGRLRAADRCGRRARRVAARLPRHGRRAPPDRARVRRFDGVPAGDGGMRPPPRWVRRVVLAPLVIALALALLPTSPAWVLLTLAASPLVPGRLRPLRLLWLATVYLLVEAVALVVMFGLWLASGLGWKVRGPFFQRAHYRLCGRAL